MMESANHSLGPIAASSKLFARRLLTIGENRLELLTVEVQEERERLLHALWLGLGVAVFGFLAGVALTVALVVWLWHRSPVAVLLVLTASTPASPDIFIGASPRSSATGKRSRQLSINSKGTAHVWKEFSSEPARIAETIIGRGKRTQSRPTGRGMG